MSEFSDLAAATSDASVDELEKTIRRHVAEADHPKVAIDRAVLARANSFAVDADDAVGYLDAAGEAQARLTATELANKINTIQADAPTLFAVLATGVAQLRDVEKTARDFVGQISPAIGSVDRAHNPSKAESSRLAKELAAAKKEFAELLDQQRDALSGLREANSESATSRLSGDYEARADSHRDASRHWLYGVGGVTAAFAVLIVWLLIEIAAAGADVDVWPILTTKISIGAVLSYALFFCSRNYRANRHLEIAYRSRGTILQVAQALRSSVTDETAQAAIMETAVVAAFSVPESGLVRNSGEDDSTLAGLLAMALARGIRA